ncbi:SDR family NAD(P)-dependent oxidoreductase [Amycolatopsis jejuensis]|uniref:SDR family NAD(P)-dependent oxidoreductase n=1 Tax=Amycolatopsis jejuensis TaxID=330084 RepID=UPI000524DDA3|nr:glucose 1-dehydrogenase [Amycolatopsis jejuensis]
MARSQPQPLLAGKVAVITGAASGIGRAMADLFTTLGAQVVAADVDQDGLAELARENRDVTVQHTDVSDENQVKHLIDFAYEKYGRLTTLCSNAGISLPGTALELSTADLRRTLDVNLLGPFHGAKYAIPYLREAGGGSIVNTGSANSLQAEKSLVGYSASKGAILMMTKAMALDHAADGIRVNCLCPGFVDTPINLPHYERLGGIEAVRESLVSWVPMARGGEPEEIAGAAAWLASDLSRYVTGAAIPVDGGLTAQL